MRLLVEGAIESSLVLLVAFGALALLRGGPSALRHAVLALALGCAAIAPVLGRAVPSWQLPVAIARLTGDVVVQPPISRERIPARRPAVTGLPETAAPGPAALTIVSALRAIWIAGVGCALLVLVAGFRRLSTLASGARPVPAGTWTDGADAIARQYDIGRPISLLLSAHPSLIVTWGFRRPKVVLPAAAADWPHDRVRIVLSHELAHVRRRDWLVMLGAEALKCVYWFNPLVWIACARLRHESEQACDDEVINGGVEPTAYAGELVDIARDLTRYRPWMPAPAISRTSRFERRVKAMLDNRRNRGPVSRRAYAALATLMIAVTGAIASAQGGFASLTGSIVDPMNGVLPGVTLVLTNVASEAKFEVRTDGTGRYEFVALPAGDYLFEAKLPGFMTFKGKLTVAGQNVQRDLTMEIGSLQETVTVANSRSNPSTSVAPVASAPKPKPPRPPCGGAPAADRLWIGGNIRPPLKLKDVRPIYAAHLAAQGVEGTVSLKAVIGTDGAVENLDVVSTPHPELGYAAADAVRQWEFTETLLNCKPVPVSMTVTINFTLRP
jgi:TonB family protein